MNYSFSIEHAQQYGVNEAIMLQNFLFWIRHNAANNIHQHDGKTWTYNSKKALNKLFPFWSYDQVKGVLNSLINQGVLVTGNYNKLKFDRTLWYAFKDEHLFLGDLEKEPGDHKNQPVGKINHSQKANSISAMGKIPHPIPDSKPDKKPLLKNNNYTNQKSDAQKPELEPVVVVELEKTFSSEELPAAKKLINSVPVQVQLEVLAVLTAAIKSNKVTSGNIGYLSGIVKNVNNGTFTAPLAQVRPQSSAERIEKEKIKQAEAEKQGKVDNVRFFVDLYKKCGSMAAIPGQYLQAVTEQLASQGIVLKPA